MHWLFRYGAIFETTQLLVAIVGWGLTRAALVDAQSDRLFVTDSGHNGVNLTKASSAIRQERGRLIVQSLFIAIGIVTLCLPPPPDVMLVHGQIGALLLLEHLLVLAASSVLTWKAYKDRADRRSLLTAWRLWRGRNPTANSGASNAQPSTVEPRPPTKE